VAILFLKLGTIAFGGPAAHIAMMHDEVVVRRKWMDEERFLDLLGATNLIPGPNSTEMAIHIGFLRAGWVGLALAGVCFILPAMLIVMALAWAYDRFGSTPQLSWVLYGVKPVVIAIIAQAFWGLGRTAIKGWLTAIVGLATIGAYFFDVNVLILLVVGGAVVMLSQNAKRLKSTQLATLLFPLGGLGIVSLAGEPFSLGLMFLTFLKISTVLYVSGYVLLAFLRADFVTNLGWLTDRQLLDAVAIGQVTPGPVFTTATFIGYLLGGAVGAILATVGIFLPAFVFVGASNPLIPRVRASAWMRGFLDGVNVASLGLVAAVTLQLGQAALIDPLAWIIALGSLILLFRFKINTTVLIAAGAALGVIVASIR
jgi:chromate transporter